MIHSVSVVLATRNRPQDAVRAVASILANPQLRFELVVVDQSDGTETAKLLAGFAGDPRFRLLCTQGRGVSIARNLGCNVTSGEWIFFTDDDCVVDPKWIDGFVEAFSRDERIGMVFGSVNAPAYDRSAGMIPAYCAPDLRVVAGIRAKAEVEGIGASMALRRSAWERVGGFDEALGVNSAFCSGEDTDMAVRVLLAGYRVAETSRAAVVHYGFRSWEQAPKLIDNYMLGLGAVQAKLVRLAGPRAFIPLVALAWRWVAGKPVVDLNFKPRRRDRLGAFLRGFGGGMRRPIDARGRFAA